MLESELQRKKELVARICVALKRRQEKMIKARSRLGESLPSETAHRLCLRACGPEFQRQLIQKIRLSACTQCG